MLFSRAQLLRPSVRGVTTVKAWFRYASGNSNGLEVSENRLWHALQSTGDMGGSLDGGLTRLSCDDNDKTVRDWFAKEVKDLGCEYKVDAIGTQWATLKGENDSIPPIGIGSHLDSVVSGGKFDGPLGVLTALEVLKVLRASGKKTYAPISAINWTNEEGARFWPGCMGSSVWAEKLDLDFAHSCVDSTDASITMKNELNRIGYLGTVQPSFKANPLSAHFEIHIEQGTRLENSGADVGVVNTCTGMKWFDIVLTGFTRHAATTEMKIRRDALVGAAKLVLEIEKIGMETPNGFSFVSVFKVSPQNVCNLPGEVAFTCGMQHVDTGLLQSMADKLQDAVKRVAAESKLEITKLEQALDFDPAPFDTVAVSCVEAAAKELGYKYDIMESHAAHDSVFTQMVVPTAMVFTPCKAGISHSPLEYATPENCSIGAQTILGAVLRYDDYLREKHSKLK